MTTIALVGPDGAGKTTQGLLLESTLPVPAKYLYMGLNYEASNRLLPHNRLMLALRRRGRRAPAIEPQRATSTHPFGRAVAAGRALAKFVNLLGEGVYRQVLARRYERQGYVVILDRHFFSDYQPTGHPPASLRARARSLRRAILARAMGKPDLMIHLDAPPAVMLARKGEGTLESLGRQRAAYRRLGELLPNFASVDSDRPAEDVGRDVLRIVCDFLARSTGDPRLRGLERASISSALPPESTRR